MRGLAHDIRFALRMLRRTPAFTLAAMMTLALGIAASTAIFSAANAALLKPLPYPRAEDIWTVRTDFTDGNQTTGLVAPVEFFRLQDPKLPLERFAMARRGEATLLLADSTPITTVVANVSEGFFELFGLPYTVGGFTAEHFKPKGPFGAVISHRLWREVYGSDPHVVGKTLQLAEAGPMKPTILGVAAPDMNVPQGADVWFNVQLNPNETNFAHIFDGYLRVRPGVTDEQLHNTMTAVAKGLERDYPGPQTNRIFIIQSYMNSIVGDLRPILIIVLAATGLLLLLACVNVTNLLLARGTLRGRELAARSALGASRTRLVRQMHSETAVLAAIGAVAGVALAYASVRGFLAYGAARHLPRLESVPFEWPVLAFAVAVLVGVTILVGLVPAVQLSGTNVQALITERGRSVRGGRTTHRTLSTMIVAEISVAIMLVAGAGWLVRSFTAVQAVDPGFEHKGRLAFDLSLPFDKYRDPSVRTHWVRTLTANLQGLKGVKAVGVSSAFPLRPETDGTALVQIKGAAGPPFISRSRVVSSGFFQAMGIRMRSGRGFTDDDRLGGAPVTIVNQAFAKKYLTGIDLATTDLAFGWPVVRQETRGPIIGIVDDVKYASLIGDFEAAYYVVYDQAFSLRTTVAVATTLDDPTSLIPAVRAEVKKMDPLLAVNVQPVDTLVEAAVARQKLGMTLMLIFGAVALVLAAIGIYGVVAYASAERRAEVATRLALGATPANIFWLLVRHGRVMTAAGIVIGLGGAYAAGRLASTWLYAVQAWDPAILGTALAAVLVVTLVAMLIPAWRASQVDPAYALRGD
jgi:putative ABC transport system permease protein